MKLVLLMTQNILSIIKIYLKYNTQGQTITFSNWIKNLEFVLIYQKLLSSDILYLYFKEENQRLKGLFVLYIQSFKYTFTSIRKSRTTTSKVGQGGQNANLFIKLIARILIKTINNINIQNPPRFKKRRSIVIRHCSIGC